MSPSIDCSIDGVENSKGSKMSFQNTFIPFKLTEPERRISRLKLWLDREKHALSQRGEAGCSQCHNAVRSLDMDSLETPEIPDSATLHDDLGKAGQRMKHLNAMILRARHALSTCTQCSRFLACDGPVLRVTDHPPNFSTLPPQIPGYASAEQKGLEKSMPAFGAGHISPPLRQLPSTQISLPFPSPPQSYSGMEGSLRTLTSLPSIVQPKAPSVDVLQLSSCARVDPRFVNAVFKCKGAERAGKLKTMLDQVLNQDFIFLTRPRYDWTSFNDPDIKAYTSGTAGYLPSEMAEQITRGLAEKMTRPSRRIQEHERFLLVCHCKVLKSMGVSVHGIMQTFALRGKVSIQKLKSHLHGIVWANRLLEGLYSRGWGHQAVDILLLCKS